MMMQGARASATLVFSYFAQNIPGIEWLDWHLNSGAIFPVNKNMLMNIFEIHLI